MNFMIISETDEDFTLSTEEEVSPTTNRVYRAYEIKNVLVSNKGHVRR